MNESIPSDSPKGASREKLVEALPPFSRERVKSTSSLLEASLAQYLLRPDADPKIIDRVRNVVDVLGNSLMRGAPDKPLDEERKLDIEAGLVGAMHVLEAHQHDIRKDTMMDREVAALERFLRLVDNRLKRRIKEKFDSSD